jgi:hypothetical protein
MLSLHQTVPAPTLRIADRTSRAVRLEPACAEGRQGLGRQLGDPARSEARAQGLPSLAAA